MMKKIIDILPNRKEYCVLIKAAFDHEFCDKIITEKKPFFKEANTHYPVSYRNNERQIVDDLELSTSLFSIIKSFIPSKIQVKTISDNEKGDWKLKGLNSRIRVCRYLPNQYFTKHLDGVHYVSELEQSKLTFMIYLNSHDEFKGGRTLFYSSKENDEIIGSYKPVKGDLIVFDHNLWHSGEDVVEGEKYILRSDIIYSKSSVNIGKSNVSYNEGHLGYVWKAINFNGKLITSGRDKKIKIWDTKGQKLSDITAHDNSIVSLLKFNDTILISGSRDMSIKIWQLNVSNEFQLLSKIDQNTGTVLSLCKKNETEFISAGSNGNINVFDIQGVLLGSFKAHSEWIWEIIKINEDLYASISEDGSMVVWNIKDYSKVLEWAVSTIPITSIAIDNDYTIFIGRNDGSIIKLKLDIDSNTLKKVYEEKHHKGIIRKLFIDGDYLYSASEDTMLLIKNKNDFILIKEFQHKNFVQDVVVFEDYYISVSYDGAIVKHYKNET